jgi:hypothetical protein
VLIQEAGDLEDREFVMGLSWRPLRLGGSNLINRQDAKNAKKMQ